MSYTGSNFTFNNTAQRLYFNGLLDKDRKHFLLFLVELRVNAGPSRN